MFAGRSVLVLVELVGPVLAERKGRRHPLAPAPHRGALRAARHHHPRRGTARDHRRTRCAVIGPEGPGWSDELVLLGGRRHGDDVRHVVDLLRGAERHRCCRRTGSGRSAGATAISRCSAPRSRSAPACTSRRTTSSTTPTSAPSAPWPRSPIPLAVYVVRSSCCTCRSPGPSTRSTSLLFALTAVILVGVDAAGRGRRRPVLVPAGAGRLALGDRRRLRDDRAPAQPARARLTGRD